MCIDSHRPKVTIRSGDVFVSHQDLDDQQRVYGGAVSGEAFKAREHHASERGAQQMARRLETARLAGTLDDSLVLALLDRRSAAVEEERGPGWFTTLANRALLPNTAVPISIRRSLFQQAHRRNDIA